MPTVPKTSRDEIVRASRKLVARRGADEFTMQAAADAVGVRAPSLYKHFDDRAAILREIARDVVAQMRREIESAATTGSAAGDLRAIARAHRAFARKQPHLYALVFEEAPDGSTELARRDYAQSIDVMFERLTELGGPDRTLERARTFVALLHGFAMMEQSGAFRLGGDVDAAFEFAVDRVIDALAR